MRFQVAWFAALAALCIAGPYLLRVQPKTRRHWSYVTITLGFLVWLLLFLTPLRSP